jgi:hypothetical protein
MHQEDSSSSLPARHIITTTHTHIRAIDADDKWRPSRPTHQTKKFHFLPKQVFLFYPFGIKSIIHVIQSCVHPIRESDGDNICSRLK